MLLRQLSRRFISCVLLKQVGARFISKQSSSIPNGNNNHLEVSGIWGEGGVSGEEMIALASSCLSSGRTPTISHLEPKCPSEGKPYTWMCHPSSPYLYVLTVDLEYEFTVPKISYAYVIPVKVFIVRD